MLKRRFVLNQEEALVTSRGLLVIFDLCLPSFSTLLCYPTTCYAKFVLLECENRIKSPDPCFVCSKTVARITNATDPAERRPGQILILDLLTVS